MTQENERRPEQQPERRPEPQPQQLQPRRFSRREVLGGVVGLGLLGGLGYLLLNRQSGEAQTAANNATATAEAKAEKTAAAYDAKTATAEAKAERATATAEARAESARAVATASAPKPTEAPRPIFTAAPVKTESRFRLAAGEAFSTNEGTTACSGDVEVTDKAGKKVASYDNNQWSGQITVVEGAGFNVKAPWGASCAEVGSDAAAKKAIIGQYREEMKVTGCEKNQGCETFDEKNVK